MKSSTLFLTFLIFLIFFSIVPASSSSSSSSSSTKKQPNPDAEPLFLLWHGPFQPYTGTTVADEDPSSPLGFLSAIWHEIFTPSFFSYPSSSYSTSSNSSAETQKSQQQEQEEEDNDNDEPIHFGVPPIDLLPSDENEYMFLLQEILIMSRGGGGGGMGGRFSSSSTTQFALLAQSYLSQTLLNLSLPMNVRDGEREVFAGANNLVLVRKKNKQLLKEQQQKDENENLKSKPHKRQFEVRFIAVLNHAQANERGFDANRERHQRVDSTAHSRRNVIPPSSILEFVASHRIGGGLSHAVPAVPGAWLQLQPDPDRLVVVCQSPSPEVWALPFPEVVRQNDKNYGTTAQTTFFGLCPPTRGDGAFVRIGRLTAGSVGFLQSLSGSSSQNEKEKENENTKKKQNFRRRLLQMDEIWVPTEFAFRAFTRDGFLPTDKVRVIPEPIDTELWRRDDVTFESEYFSHLVSSPSDSENSENSENSEKIVEASGGAGAGVLWRSNQRAGGGGGKSKSKSSSSSAYRVAQRNAALLQQVALLPPEWTRHQLKQSLDIPSSISSMRARVLTALNRADLFRAVDFAFQRRNLPQQANFGVDGEKMKLIKALRRKNKKNGAAAMKMIDESKVSDVDADDEKNNENQLWDFEKIAASGGGGGGFTKERRAKKQHEEQTKILHLNSVVDYCGGGDGGGGGGDEATKKTNIFLSQLDLASSPRGSDDWGHVVRSFIESILLSLSPNSSLSSSPSYFSCLILRSSEYVYNPRLAAGVVFDAKATVEAFVEFLYSSLSSSSSSTFSLVEHEKQTQEKKLEEMKLKRHRMVREAMKEEAGLDPHDLKELRETTMRELERPYRFPEGDRALAAELAMHQRKKMDEDFNQNVYNEKNETLRRESLYFKICSHLVHLSQQQQKQEQKQQQKDEKNKNEAERENKNLNCDEIASNSNLWRDLVFKAIFGKSSESSSSISSSSSSSTEVADNLRILLLRGGDTSVGIGSTAPVSTAASSTMSSTTAFFDENSDENNKDSESSFENKEEYGFASTDDKDHEHKHAESKLRPIPPGQQLTAYRDLVAVVDFYVSSSGGGGGGASDSLSSNSFSNSKSNVRDLLSIQRRILEAMALAVPPIVVVVDDDDHRENENFEFEKEKSEKNGIILVDGDSSSSSRRQREQLSEVFHRVAKFNINNTTEEEEDENQSARFRYYRRLGALARKFVVEHHDLAVVGQQVLDAVDDVASKRSEELEKEKEEDV